MSESGYQGSKEENYIILNSDVLFNVETKAYNIYLNRV